MGIAQNLTPDCDSMKLSKSVLFEAIRTSPRGSGAGPSGWYVEHFKALAGNIATADGLYSVCHHIASGCFPDGVSKLLSASKLIALPKKNSDIRPIAVGESLRRLTAKAICLQNKESFASFLSPLQHGVSMKGGSECLVHHIQLLLESNPGWVILGLDVKNAFNSISRSHMLKEVQKSFPEVISRH